MLQTTPTIDFQPMKRYSEEEKNVLIIIFWRERQSSKEGETRKSGKERTGVRMKGVEMGKKGLLTKERWDSERK